MNSAHGADLHGEEIGAYPCYVADRDTVEEADLERFRSYQRNILSP